MQGYNVPTIPGNTKREDQRNYNKKQKPLKLIPLFY